ncbi:MAG: glycoside hydrolase family 2 protein, partial [Marivirga sp.]|nr:glycoside hydrolase family 2 protein [Marivirga sp.]
MVNLDKSISPPLYRQCTRFCKLVLIPLYLIAFESCQPVQTTKPGWPEITRETKPWTRWWWQGSAVTKDGITAEMEAYQKAGIGGLEITPIYGVVGYEDKFVDYLSPEWIELFLHTLKEAERLDMGIDMATGTGWPFGGPWVKDEDACKNFHHKIYELENGQRLAEKIEFIQPPYLRAVGNQVYEVNDSFSTERTITQGTRKEPLSRIDPKSIDIKTLKQPVDQNKNLQALALDQVIFERPLALQTLMAFGDGGQTINLTKHVDKKGNLDWIAPQGKWKLYAIFEGWHGKMVERAGPGGEGNVIDHFSGAALRNYLSRFDNALAGKDIQTLRAFFNDSYEVDDARGAADWTPSLFPEFEKRRGYKLEEHLPSLFGNKEDEMHQRILCDYRETISEMVLDNFTRPWGEWAHGKSAIIRNQAHGAPSNILDLYAAVDIPEIEGVEPLRIKMASSAGNVTGKKLISSESATWLNEHFESNLADIKIALDRFMLNGVNHLFYHGTSYSPPGEPWPGWLFYAAVHLNPRNPLWSDFDALNNYVARCQSFLQNATPDNDVLLYYSIYDR